MVSKVCGLKHFWMSWSVLILINNLKKEAPSTYSMFPQRTSKHGGGVCVSLWSWKLCCWRKRKLGPSVAWPVVEACRKMPGDWALAHGAWLETVCRTKRSCCYCMCVRRFASCTAGKGSHLGMMTTAIADWSQGLGISDFWCGKEQELVWECTDHALWMQSLEEECRVGMGRLILFTYLPILTLL